MYKIGLKQKEDCKRKTVQQRGIINTYIYRNASNEGKMHLNALI